MQCLSHLIHEMVSHGRKALARGETLALTRKGEFHFAYVPRTLPSHRWHHTASPLPVAPRWSRVLLAPPPQPAPSHTPTDKRHAHTSRTLHNRPTAQPPKLTPSVRTASYHLWFTVGGCALPQQVVTDVQRLPWTITPQLYDDLTAVVRRENGGMPPPDARVPHTTPPRARAHCVSPTCPRRAHTPAHTPAHTVLVHSEAPPLPRALQRLLRDGARDGDRRIRPCGLGAHRLGRLRSAVRCRRVGRVLGTGTCGRVDGQARRREGKHAAVRTRHGGARRSWRCGGVCATAGGRGGGRRGGGRHSNKAYNTTLLLVRRACSGGYWLGAGMSKQSSNLSLGCLLSECSFRSAGFAVQRKVCRQIWGWGA